MSSPSARRPYAPVAATRRLRQGELDGPEYEPWELSTADGCDRARCTAFLERLDGMAREDWLELGRAVLADDVACRGRRAAASAALDRVLATRGLRVTAWLLHDRVETAVHAARTRSSAARRSRMPWTAAERTLLRAARGAAAVAAVAHLVSPWVAPADHLTLILPFLTLVGDERE